MLKFRLSLAWILLALFVQNAFASTIWLKNSGKQLCSNNLSSNPGTPSPPLPPPSVHPIGYGGIDQIGAFQLTISNPDGGAITPASTKGNTCLGFPRTGAPAAETTIVFNGPLTSEISNINAIRTGTGGVGECQRQGNNLTGVSGNLVSTSGAYRLTFTYSFVNGCDPDTHTQITSDGQPSFTRGFTLTRLSDNVVVVTGTYHVFDINSLPEPGSLTLILAGALAALSLGLIKRRVKA